MTLKTVPQIQRNILNLSFSRFPNDFHCQNLETVCTSVNGD